MKLLASVLAAGVVGIAPVALSDPLGVEDPGQLPTALTGSTYLQLLQAEGGTPPYSWTAQVPAEIDMTLSANGVLSGTPAQATNGPVPFSVTVTDSVGALASATVTLAVIEPNLLTIVTPFFDVATVGLAYDETISASDSNVPNPVLAWTVGGLPPGIEFTQVGSPAVARLSGIPLLGGAYRVVVNLSDNLGNTTSRQYTFEVTGNPIRLPPQVLPVAVIGEKYVAQIQSSYVTTPIWTIVSGALPTGLSLSAGGAISGMVATGSTPISYPFLAVASDSSASGTIVSANLAIEVQVPPPAGGCATGGGSAGPGLLVIGMGWLAVRRGRRLHQA